MKSESRQILNVGVNYVFVPAPILSDQSALIFQQHILSNGLDYQKVDKDPRRLVVTRTAPSTLEIAVVKPDEQLGQFLVFAPNLHTSLELFIQEAEAAVKAFEFVWKMSNRQIVQRDITLRELYETTTEHAFQELWEQRLGQSAKALSVFDRPIRGGGLRFVFEPTPADPIQIEVKIESSLQDTKKIFVETQFRWILATQIAQGVSVREDVTSVEDFTQNQVRPFILGGA
jgi:hypothetical protein